jgi:hypothetical protein
MHWLTTAADRNDERFIRAGPAARLLYIDAGAWCMQQVFNNRYAELPDTHWFVPHCLIEDWGKRKAASALVREGLWRRVDGGYEIVCLVYENTPDYVRAKREMYRKEYRRKNPRNDR